jgi:hypothetical protein
VVDRHHGDLRFAYEEEMRGLVTTVELMRADGATIEAIARTVSGDRLELSRRYKAATPEPLRSRIIVRTVAEYGNPVAPTSTSCADAARAGRRSLPAPCVPAHRSPSATAEILAGKTKHSI